VKAVKTFVATTTVNSIVNGVSMFAGFSIVRCYIKRTKLGGWKS
jgi:hypothetical protein